MEKKKKKITKQSTTASRITYTSAKSKATAGQFNLTSEICRELPVPVCGSEEQAEVAARIEECLSVVENSEKEIETALQRAEIRRQSILKKAFSGQLFRQDSNDEPVSVLLERIRAEKAAPA